MIDVVGLGAGGLADLPPAATDLVTRADVLLGGARHLRLVPPKLGQTRVPWPSPLRAGLPALLDELDVRAAPAGHVVALASGDPLRSGIATTLIGLLGRDQVRVHPAVSSVTLARARMGWPAEETTVVPMVGASLDRLRRLLDPSARLVVLCADGSTPARIARFLTDEGLAATTLTAWWQLGGPAEGSRTSTAAAWGDHPTPDLVTVCLEVDDATARGRPAAGPAPGRPDTVFDHDGQISKRDSRAAAVARLRPTPGAHLWDLGAGSGAVGIEWALAAPGATVTAVERDPVRAARICENAATLGVPGDVTVVTGESAAVLDQLAQPDAVFVGGGLSADLLDDAWRRLPAGGRFVAAAVTLETEAVLVAAAARYGGELTRLSVERAVPLGGHLSWTPARPVVHWSVTKEEA